MLNRDWEHSYHTKEVLLELSVRKTKNKDSGHVTRGGGGRDHGDHRLYMESKVTSAEILILAYSNPEGDGMVNT